MRHRRVYTADDLEHFRSLRDQRALAAPPQCDHQSLCWVELGPPAMENFTRCAGCKGVPGMIRAVNPDRRQPTKPRK
jgi:hypothetical protein